MTGRAICAATALALTGLLAACGGTAKRSDPPVLVPWSRVGDIRLGEPFEQVRAAYGHEAARGYPLHGGYVTAGSYVGGDRVTVIDVTSPYYRTTTGFGIGSRFPRRWRHTFLDNPTLKESPCHCWVKIGAGKRSLLPGPHVFLKPWVIVYLRGGRVSEILMSSKYVD